MTGLQIKKYWREWAAVKRACAAAGWDCPERHQLHIDALGYAASSRAFSEDEFDFVLAEMWKYSRADDVNAQLRQIRQPRARLVKRIELLIEQLREHREHAEEYVSSIVHDLTRGATVDWSDLSERRPAHGKPSPLMGLCWNLQNALNGRDGMRAQAEQTEHRYQEEEAAVMEGEPF